MRHIRIEQGNPADYWGSLNPSKDGIERHMVFKASSEAYGPVARVTEKIITPPYITFDFWGDPHTYHVNARFHTCLADEEEEEFFLYAVCRVPLSYEDKPGFPPANREVEAEAVLIGGLPDTNMTLNFRHESTLTRLRRKHRWKTGMLTNIRRILIPRPVRT